METVDLTNSSIYQEHLFTLCDRLEKDLTNYQRLLLPDDDAEKSDILQALGYDVDAIVRSISVALDWVRDAVTRYVSENNIRIKTRILEDCCFVLGCILRSITGTTKHTLGVDGIIRKLDEAEDAHLISLRQRLDSIKVEYGHIAMTTTITLEELLRG